MTLLQLRLAYVSKRGFGVLTAKLTKWGTGFAYPMENQAASRYERQGHRTCPAILFSSCVLNCRRLDHPRHPHRLLAQLRHRQVLWWRATRSRALQKGHRRVPSVGIQSHHVLEPPQLHPELHHRKCLNPRGGSVRPMLIGTLQSVGLLVGSLIVAHRIVYGPLTSADFVFFITYLVQVWTSLTLYTATANALS